MSEVVFRVVAGVGLLGANGFFVGTEFALTRVRQFDKVAFEGHRGLERAWKMTDELEIYLSGCQVGITISSVLLGVVAEPAVSAVFGGVFTAAGITSSAGHSTMAIVLSLVVINFLHVILAEQVPTYLGVERARAVAKYMAPILYLWVVLMGPVIRGADWVSKGILRRFGVEITRSWTEEEDAVEGGEGSLTETKRELGTVLSGAPLSDERKAEVMNALDISSVTVSEIMTPASEIRAPREGLSSEETLDYLQERPHTRYPLADDDGSHYIGTVYTASIVQQLSALQAGEIGLRDVAVKLMVVDPEMAVSTVIDQFQGANQELAVVTKSPERPVPIEAVEGVVTSTDAFEAITGELEDPVDVQEDS